MTIPVIPDSAPFTVEQRAWLNGFFAGVFGLNGFGLNGFGLNGEQGQMLSGQGLLERSSTASGNGNGHAHEPATEETFPWHDPALPLQERLKLADGKPFERRLMAAMAQLNCGACGYLCQTYSEAIARGDERDLTKCSPGGTETARALKRLFAEKSANGSPVAGGSSGASASPNGKHGIATTAPEDRTALPAVPRNLQTGSVTGAHGRSPVFPARLLESNRLTDPEAPKDTRHVVIDLRDCGLTYQPGDSLGILPLNCAQLVESVVQALGATGGELIPAGDRSFRVLREVLQSDFTLARSRPALLELLVKHARSAKDASTLQQSLAADDESLLSLDVAELLERFPSARPPVEEFLGALSHLQPRLYSIASSPRAHPGEVHLTVGVVRFESLGRWRHGVASHFLGVRSQPGDEVNVFVQSSPKFRLPADSQAPIIMVGPGTGIAPFRAFLEEREATGAEGRNWLFFGNQHLGYDYLYREQLEGWHDRGLLARLDLAFSRDQIEKLYVQHRMLEQGAELWRWLQEGAYFYVCGDAKRMAFDVDQALQAIAAEHGRFSAEQAKAYVGELARSNRYLKDVY